MVLFFSSAAVLHEVLSTDRVSLSAGGETARACFDSSGSIWIEPKNPLSKSVLAQLEAFGVTWHDRDSQPLVETVRCWHELVPLERVKAPCIGPESRVLFETKGHLLASQIGEIQRLGCQRIEFRWLSDDRALLRVIRPPALSLLRACDRRDEEMVAYVEHRPGIWIEAGFTHPLVSRLSVPTGHVLCIRLPRQWTLHDDGSFRDVSASVSLPISDCRCPATDDTLPHQISVPLQLVWNNAWEQADLWVIKNAGVQQLQQLINQVDDRTVSRLLFAVAAKDGKEFVAIRCRSARYSSPEPLLDGIAFQSYLRIPNLFVPRGNRLQPPLRRNAVRSTLMLDPDRVTWLFPDGDGFVPESLPESAFRPLDEWVEYRAENSPRVLAPWPGSPSFPFETFAINEEAPRKFVVTRQRAKAMVTPIDKTWPSMLQGKAQEQRPSSRVSAAPLDGNPELLVQTQLAPDVLRQRLSELESAFLQLHAPLDAPERQVLWRQMANAHAALNHPAEAALCWSYPLWEEQSLQAECIVDWRRNETAFRIEEGEAATPSSAAIRSLCAYLVHAASIEPVRLHSLARIIEKNEGSIPVRVAWLANFALFGLAKGDVLALTRARDRLLERLFQFGLRFELDLPGFVRFSSKVGHERVAAVREHLHRLRQLVRTWLGKHPRSPFTPVYAELTFAFGLARLGERTECDKALADCGKALKGEDELHRWLYDAYASRIREAMRGEPSRTALPDELLARLNRLPSEPHYKGDRLRQFSRILEPHEKVDARFRWHEHYPDEIERELAYLSRLADRAELAKRLNALLDRKLAADSHRMAILARALELAPRLGQDFACALLGRVVPSLAETTAPTESQALILEKGMVLAAHFDQTPFAVSFVERFMQMVAAGAAAIQAIEPLIGQLFLGLRKFGLRDVVGQLLERLTVLIAKGHDLQQLRLRIARQAEQGMLRKDLSTWKVMLHVASGWLYFGGEEQASSILNETRTLLFQGVLHPLEQMEIACLYIRTLGQADLEPAANRWMELFRRIERIDAVFTTDSHFSLAQLSLIETLVLTLASDEFALDPQAQHWLEDDEYLVWRRIHRDVKRAMQEADA